MDNGITVKEIEDLKRWGETLSIFVQIKLNNDPNNALHELFKEEEPTSLKELSEELGRYAGTLSFNLEKFPDLRSNQDQDQVSRAIAELNELTGQFQSKLDNNANSDFSEPLRKLATYFNTKHLLIDSYYNALINKLESSRPEPTTARL